MTDHITASPLTWPTGWPRARKREDSRFGQWNVKPTIHAGTQDVIYELGLMGVDRKDIIVSTDLKLRNDGLPYSKQRTPDDVGVAVYWRDRAGNDRVIALDKYTRIGCNLRAIARTLEALRGIERWGGGQILDRAFTGFTALPTPETAGGVDPYELLGITPEAGPEERSQAYRRARSKAHPDRPGGSAELYDQVQRAAQQLGIVG